MLKIMEESVVEFAQEFYQAVTSQNIDKLNALKEGNSHMHYFCYNDGHGQFVINLICEVVEYGFINSLKWLIDNGFFEKVQTDFKIAGAQSEDMQKLVEAYQAMQILHGETVEEVRSVLFSKKIFDEKVLSSFPAFEKKDSAMIADNPEPMVKGSIAKPFLGSEYFLHL